MSVVLDDHRLRDWMAGPDDDLRAAVAGDEVMTTNLWCARLCKSAARGAGGALLGGWPEPERQLIVAGLVALPPSISIVPMRLLAWRMALLGAAHGGLSMLGAEEVASAEHVGGGLLVSARDDGPGIRRCCEEIDVPYVALPRDRP
jgi:hypothetical protein